MYMLVSNRCYEYQYYYFKVALMVPLIFVEGLKHIFNGKLIKMGY